jgi:hypothetical protein
MLSNSRARVKLIGSFSIRESRMARVSTLQLALKPHDLFVLFALLTRGDQSVSYPELAAQTGLAPSAAHGAVKRAVASGLAASRDRRPAVLKPQLREFVLHGARYAFPAAHGKLVRGMPTAYAAPPLDKVIASSADPIPVWPDKNGKTRGVSLSPLYHSVPEAARRDPKLYELLALFDAIRSGQARERSIAQKMLEERMQ